VKRVFRRLVLSAAVVVCTTIAIGPAQAASLPILHAAASPAGFAHTCAATGDSVVPGEEVVVCADIVTGTNSSGYYAEGQLELYCQVSTLVVPCDGITVTGGLFRQSNTSWTGASWSCGTYSSSGTACPGQGQRKYFVTNEFTYGSSYDSICTNDVNGATAVWSVALTAVFSDESGDYEADTVETPHYFICP
jgi:hypothetical protein